MLPDTDDICTTDYLVALAKEGERADDAFDEDTDPEVQAAAAGFKGNWIGPKHRRRRGARSGLPLSCTNCSCCRCRPACAGTWASAACALRTALPGLTSGAPPPVSSRGMHSGTAETSRGN